MFYIEENNKIVLADENKQKLENTLLFMPQYANLEIKETDRPIIDFKFADTDEYKAEQEKKEKERINGLTITAWDFVRAIKTLGVTDDQVLQIMEARPDIKLELTLCQNVYCSRVKEFCPITIGDIELTDNQVEQLFLLVEKTKASE